MKRGRFGYAVLPGFGALAALAVLASLVACAESSEGTSPPEDDAGHEGGAPAIDSGDVDAGRATPDAKPLDTCSPGGFCPTPMSEISPIFGITALGEDAWAIGKAGVVHWDSASWKMAYPMTLDPAAKHAAIWLGNAGDLWVATSPTVVHSSNGGGAGARSFRKLDTVYRIHGSWADPASDALYAVAGVPGDPPGLRRFREEAGNIVDEDVAIPIFPANGTYWWKTVWGFAADDIYVAGDVCNVNNCDFDDNQVYGAIAHYDGAAWTVALLGQKERVNAIFGTPGGATPKRLWLWTGIVGQYNASTTSLRLVPVAADASLGAPVHSQDLLFPAADPSAREQCVRVVGSAPSADLAWISNGCLVYRWDGAKLDVVPTAVNNVPVGRVDALWAGPAGQAWIGGESTELSVGFVAQRKAGSNP